MTEVVFWGKGSLYIPEDHIPHILGNVRCIQANTSYFAAVLEDDSVACWPYPDSDEDLEDVEEDQEDHLDEELQEDPEDLPLCS